MKAGKIISNIKIMIEDERREIGRHLAKLAILQDILHMAQEDGVIKKRENIPSA